MLQTSAASVPLPAAAAALMVVMVALQLPAAASAAAATPPQAPVMGKPNCSTTCGNVRVPYPFGFGPSHCYWPGLNLICDTRRSGPPRLLLSNDGTLRVTDISLRNRTVRVVRAGFILNATGDLISDAWNVPFGRGFTEHGYQLSSRNELVVSGCNVVARILADIGEKTLRIIGGCASFCTIIDREDGPLVSDSERDAAVVSKYCTGTAGCCQAPISVSGPPNGVQARWLYSNHAAEQRVRPANVFVAEEGWVDANGLLGDDGLKEAPILLEWSVTRGLPQHQDCDSGIGRMLCRSEHSRCSNDGQGRFTCQCDDGYDGNPYLPGGCQGVAFILHPRWPEED